MTRHIWKPSSKRENENLLEIVILNRNPFNYKQFNRKSHKIVNFWSYHEVEKEFLAICSKFCVEFLLPLSPRWQFLIYKILLDRRTFHWKVYPKNVFTEHKTEFKTHGCMWDRIKEKYLSKEIYMHKTNQNLPPREV